MKVSSDTAKRKADTACIYCRRSHMTCSNHRPCERCIKRNIGHLCRDELNPRQQRHANAVSKASAITATHSHNIVPHAAVSTPGCVVPGPGRTSFSGALEASSQGATTAESDPQSVSVHDPSSHMVPHPSIPAAQPQMSHPMHPPHHRPLQPLLPQPTQDPGTEFHLEDFASIFNADLWADVSGHEVSHGVKNPPASGTPSTHHSHGKVLTADEFMLEAADPAGTAEHRLDLVIHAKHQAGLLQPYNYPAGYDRLQGYMNQYMSELSRQRILRSLATFRPAFRAVARRARDVDLEAVEETFDRMLLDYDRIFTAMSLPACLWRRTGEIYRANKEFAELVETNLEDLREGKLAIYELMSEESAVAYWEKFSSVAFHRDQKAVMSSCNLRARNGRKRRQCCFCFTIRRDRFNVPSCIVGNFIPVRK